MHRQRIAELDTIILMGHERFVEVGDQHDLGIGDLMHFVHGLAYPGAVDIREIFPNAEFDILFASSRNITGHAMYPAIPLMEESTAAKLSEAYARFQDDGYYLKVYDAYRPKSAQYELFDIVQNNKFIANPNNGNSWHQRGRAIDMSLVWIDDGSEVETPTPMHTFDDASARYSSGNWSEAARANVDYMTEVMTACGFTTLSTEWWHYEYRGPGVDMENNIDYSTITFERARLDYGYDMYEKSLGSVYQYQLFVLVIGWFRYQVSERYLRNILFFEGSHWRTSTTSAMPAAIRICAS